MKHKIPLLSPRVMAILCPANLTNARDITQMDISLLRPTTSSIYIVDKSPRQVTSVTSHLFTSHAPRAHYFKHSQYQHNKALAQASLVQHLGFTLPDLGYISTIDLALFSVQCLLIQVLIWFNQIKIKQNKMCTFYYLLILTLAQTNKE